MMKEQIHTIPVNEAFDAGDECPFCFMERQLERSAIRYFAGPGASYMEPDVRLTTDKAGFCREHMKKLYDYGNPLGSGLIIRSYMQRLRRELNEQLAHHSRPPKRSLFPKVETTEDSLTTWIRKRMGTCYMCRSMDENLCKPLFDRWEGRASHPKR